MSSFGGGTVAIEARRMEAESKKEDVHLRKVERDRGIVFRRKFGVVSSQPSDILQYSTGLFDQVRN
jgi:hypothetical protein